MPPAGSRFNEAAGYYPRKPDGDKKGRVRLCDASMRPRGITRGNLRGLAGFLLIAQASMRPRGITRGNSPLTTLTGVANNASMRPRGITRGNTIASARLSKSFGSFNEAAGYYPRKR